MKKLITLFLLSALLLSAKPHQNKATNHKSKQNISFTKKKSSKKTKKNSKSLYFANCKEAKSMGYSNIKRGEAGYRPKLDRDNDGIACER